MNEATTTLTRAELLWALVDDGALDVLLLGRTERAP